MPASQIAIDEEIYTLATKNIIKYVTFPNYEIIAKNPQFATLGRGEPKEDAQPAPKKSAPPVLEFNKTYSYGGENFQIVPTAMFPSVLITWFG